MGMMVLGLNHRTASVELREQLAFSREGAAAALLLFKQLFPEGEAAILSTCNRVEVLINGDNIDDAAATTFLSRAKNVPVASFIKHLYIVRDRQAIRQVFRVISGLDSMVLGEYQIVNQLKTAYQMAHEQGTAGAVLHRLFHHAFGVSKRVRSETTLGEGKTSIPSVAVDVIRRSVPDFANRRILIVGAGDMAQLAAQHLKAADARELVITARTLQNARILADACGGQAVPFAELDEELAVADVVICATSCPTSILTTSRIQRALAQRNVREMLLIDLSVPRNIDAEAGEIRGVTLHDVDALGGIVDAVHRQRAAAVELSEKIVEEELEAFDRWMAQVKVGPMIEQMFDDVRAMAQIEVRGFLRKNPEFNPDQQRAIEQLADRLVAKLLHPCVSTIRQSSPEGHASMLVNAFHTTRLNIAGAA